VEEVLKVIRFSVEVKNLSDLWNAIRDECGEVWMFSDFEESKRCFDDAVRGGTPGYSYRIVAHEYEKTYDKVVIQKKIRSEMVCLVCKANHMHREEDLMQMCPYCGNDNMAKNVYLTSGDA
jgi:ribosomal protein L37AE/L43A